MNADEALRQFAEAPEIPREALQWSLDHWDEASPRFIARLRAAASGARAAESEAMFYVVHLCGEKRDARAYSPLCRWIASDPQFGEWFGDATAQTLPGLLINLCDGDTEPLRALIAAERADPFARGAALDALAYLTRAKGVFSDEEMRAFLAEAMNELAPRGPSPIWSAWAFAVAELGYESMRADVARVFAKGWIDREDAILEDFYRVLALARRDADGLAAFKEARIGPFGSTIATLESWAQPLDGEGGGPDAGDYGAPEAPFVNPLREVGRNDPCPCGSGKKFKKCCLAA